MVEGMGEANRLKDLEKEDARLKKLVADLTLDKEVLEIFAEVVF